MKQVCIINIRILEKMLKIKKVKNNNKRISVTPNLCEDCNKELYYCMDSDGKRRNLKLRNNKYYCKECYKKHKF